MILNKKINLKKNHIVYRKLPINYTDSDRYIFENELIKSIDDTYLFKIKSVMLVSDTLITFPCFKFYPAETHINGSFDNKLILDYRKKLNYPSKFLKKGIWITQNWTWMYFHWMIDALTRFIACKDYLLNHPILVPNTYLQYPYIKESLDYLEIPYVLYDTSITTYVYDLILPSHTAFPGNYNVEYLKELRRMFLQKQTRKNKEIRKVFISRINAKTRKLENEQDVCKFLISMGYEVVCLENLALDDKIFFLSSCTQLIGLHGAGLTNMIFLPDKSKVLEIRQKADSHNNAYFSMASALNLDYYYTEVEEKTNDSFIGQVDLYLNLNDFKSLLHKFEL